MLKVRFGIIGCSSIAKKAFLPAMALCESAELIAVASRSRKKADEFAAMFGAEAIEGYDNLLERNDIDAVYISTPNSMHAEWAIAAAKNGKHILCEKSLACNLKEVELILSTSEDSRVAILEGFMYQFHPQHSLVQKLVEAGEIGQPRVFNAWFGFPPRRESDIRYNRQLGGGALLDAGAYTVHSARKFFGCEPSVCAAVLYRQGYEVETQGTALLDFGEGKVATLSFGFHNFYRNTYSIWGSQGFITVARAFTVPADFSPTVILEREDKRVEKKGPAVNQFSREIEFFCNNLGDSKIRSLWRKDALGQAAALESIRLAAKLVDQ